MRYYWANEQTKKFLSKGYLKQGQSVEERVREIANYAEKTLNLPGYADKFEDYMSRGWYSLSSPIWSNYGSDNKALPISCNGSYVADNMYAILEKAAEVGAMTKNGAGTSAYFGKLRGRGALISTGGTSCGPVHFMQLYDSIVNIVSQSNIRRGSFAAYLDIDHPDIEEFLHIRSEGDMIQNISIGVCITDAWMNSMIDGDKAKRRIWGKIIKKRFESGYPYLFFVDNANKQAPQVYKDKGLLIVASNLCAETSIASSENESFVCDLSSMNLYHFDEWENTDAVEVLTYLLDAAMTDYINKTENIPFMQDSRRCAINQRTLGVGVLGWHSYLQSKMIPFESMEAKRLNVKIFKLLDKKTLKASQEMAEIYGEPPLLKGYGLRNVTRMAIAPTTSSSFILGQVSPSIEPHNSNYYTKDLAKGKFTYKNPHLEQLLEKYQKNDKETWNKILLKGGSVQSLKFLSDLEREVFKTFGEISQKEIVIQAAQRQRYIDQGQSLNIMIHPNTPAKEVSELLIEGWRLDLKSFYYQRGVNPAQELGRSNLNCQSCEA